MSDREALNKIREIINTTKDDEHGNSEPYAYRCDRMIKGITDILDEVDKPGWKEPW